ncbi:MAG: hypothetical protein ABIR51_06225 [Sphingomicrobium sp.]
MIDPITTALIGSTVIIAIAAASWAALRGWHEWLEYKRLELASHCGGEVRLNPAGGRIELADLKERVRKLEAIAAGIDL